MGCPLYFFRQSLMLNLELTDWLGWLARSSFWDPHAALLAQWLRQAGCYTVLFIEVSGIELRSSCLASSTLLMEPLLQPSLFDFCFRDLMCNTGCPQTYRSPASTPSPWGLGIIDIGIVPSVGRDVEGELFPHIWDLEWDSFMTVLWIS